MMMCYGWGDLTAGREVTPNCGFDDDGGKHEVATKPCKNDTYNDGRWAKCRPCSQCAGYVSLCSRIADAVCVEVRSFFLSVFVQGEKKKLQLPGIA